MSVSVVELKLVSLPVTSTWDTVALLPVSSFGAAVLASTVTPFVNWVLELVPAELSEKVVVSTAAWVEVRKAERDVEIPAVVTSLSETADDDSRLVLLLLGPGDGDSAAVVSRALLLVVSWSELIPVVASFGVCVLVVAVSACVVPLLLLIVASVASALAMSGVVPSEVGSLCLVESAVVSLTTAGTVDSPLPDVVEKISLTFAGSGVVTVRFPSVACSTVVVAETSLTDGAADV